MTTMPFKLRTLIREPLVQFLLIGCALLGVQQVLSPARANDREPDRITISRAQVAAMRATYQQENGRPPSAADVAQMVQQQIDSEVLYRESLRLGLEREDPIVRREMQRKMRFLIEDLEQLAAPTREDLQAWLDAHPERYARPEAVSFEQIFLSRARHGERIQFDAAQRLSALRRQPNPSGDDLKDLSDPFPIGLTLIDAGHQELERNFGQEFADAVLKQPEGQWSDPLRSSLGLHLVRVTHRKSAHHVSVEEAGKASVTDVQVERREQANRRTLEKLRARYGIEVEPGAAS
jgi:peptidyl-prolyl cis-trans isomerase C